METLGNIFGSVARIKIMRLFLFHEGYHFDFDELRKRTLVRNDALKRELRLLEKNSFIRRKMITREVKRKLKSGKIKSKKKKLSVWSLNPRFELKDPLKKLLIETKLIKEKDILRGIRKGGRLKLLVLSGIFVDRPDAEVDLLLVVDSLKKRDLEREIKKIESEIGRELRYAVFSSDEFRYRIDMYDKLARDVLENKHVVLFDSGKITWT